MNSRERVIASISHKEPDRVPIDFGGTTVTGISAVAYRNLCNFMGRDQKVKVFDVMQQLAVIDEQIKVFFGADVDPLFRPKPRFGIPIYKEWKIGKLTDGSNCLVPSGFSPVEEDRYLILKQNSMTVAKRSKKSYWFDPVYYPLKDKHDIGSLREYKWPLYSKDDFEYLNIRSKAIRSNSERVIVVSLGKEIYASLFESGQLLRGPEQFFIDLAMRKDYVSYLLDHCVENFKKNFDKLKEAVGNNVDILKLSDDFGAQDRLLISPKMFRELFKPRWKEIISYIKMNSSYKVFFHSDGAIYDIIPDLVEIGVDILNPIQLNVKGMDGARLKKKFGKELTFWGAGIDTQRLPFMGVQEIEEHIKKVIDVFAPGGGFVFSTIHNIPPETQPDKIVKIFETVKTYGR
jgi:uroporphyrinogen decarboxylase